MLRSQFEGFSPRAVAALLVTLLAASVAAPPAEGLAAAGRVPWEPKGRRVLHLVGNTVGQPDLGDYYAMVGEELAPVGEAMWISIPGTRSYEATLERLREKCEELAARPGLLNLALGFDGGDLDGFGTARDDEVAETDRHDAKIDALAAVLHETGVPTILRIGNECNGPWNGLHPFVFPKAYRKVVERLRAAGCENVAFSWCVEPRGDSGFFQEEDGVARWYPGDDVIDWYGIDPFPAACFSRDLAQEEGAPGIHANTERLLAHAREMRKPVIVGETSPFKAGVPRPGEDPKGKMARAAAEGWFLPFFEWLDDHPEVKAVTILPVDWTQTGPWESWGYARFQDDENLSKLWRKELKGSRWIHADEFPDAVERPGPASD